MTRRLLLAALVAASLTPATAQAEGPVPNERVVEFARDVTPASARASLRQAGASHIERLADTRIYRAKFPAGDAHRSAVALNSQTTVESVELNHRATLTAEKAELAQFPASTWHLRNTGTEGGTPGADVRAPQAWDISLGQNVLVAVVDTGLITGQPDLAGRLWTNPHEKPGNGRDDDRDGIVDNVHAINVLSRTGNANDDNGHGSFVAGLIAAADDGQTLIGLAPQAQILPIKALDSSGTGTDFDIAKGMHYAVMHGAKIINMSLAVNANTAALRSMTRLAEARGVLIVAAAGNNGRDNAASPMFPANFSNANVISVAASTRNDTLAPFSNYSSRYVDLAAPGLDLVSAWRFSDGPGYAIGSGTSFAAPLVSAAAALMLAQAPRLNAAAVASALKASADRVPALADRVVTGGRLNAYAALTRLGADRAAPAAAKLRSPLRTVRRKHRRVTVAFRPGAGHPTAHKVVVDGRIVSTVRTGKRTTIKRSVRLSRGKHTWWVLSLDAAGNQRIAGRRSFKVR